MRKSINEKYILLLSHLTRGAWIEIDYIKHQNDVISRTSHEVRGLKFWFSVRVLILVMRRTSHEVRGLKLSVSKYDLMSLLMCRTSHEVRGLKCSPLSSSLPVLSLVAPRLRYNGR